MLRTCHRSVARLLHTSARLRVGSAAAAAATSAANDASQAAIELSFRTAFPRNMLRHGSHAPLYFPTYNRRGQPALAAALAESLQSSPGNVDVALCVVQEVCKSAKQHALDRTGKHRNSCTYPMVGELAALLPQAVRVVSTARA